MNSPPRKWALGRVDASVWALLVPLWIYAVLVGVLAAGAGQLLASSGSRQVLITAAVVALGSAAYPAVLGWLRRVIQSLR